MYLANVESKEMSKMFKPNLVSRVMQYAPSSDYQSAVAAASNDW